MDKPVLQSVLLCDNVIKDERSKKLSFIGIFDEINARGFPIGHNLLYIVSRWINLSDGLEHKQRFNIINAEDNKEIYDSKKIEKPFSYTDEGSTHTIVAPIYGLSFKQPGSYHINFYLDDIIQPQKIYLKVRLVKK